VLNAAILTARFQTLHGYLGGIQESGALICLPIAVWFQAKVFIPVEFPVNVSCFDPATGRAALVRIKAADCVQPVRQPLRTARDQPQDAGQHRRQR
jgi:hypothetical protein